MQRKWTFAQRTSDAPRVEKVTNPGKVRVVEIAEFLGVTPPASQQDRRRAELPAPIDSEDRSRMWDRREVAAWAKEWRREKPWR